MSLLGGVFGGFVAVAIGFKVPRSRPYIGWICGAIFGCLFNVLWG